MIVRNNCTKWNMWNLICRCCSITIRCLQSILVVNASLQWKPVVKNWHHHIWSLQQLESLTSRTAVFCFRTDPTREMCWYHDIWRILRWFWKFDINQSRFLCEIIGTPSHSSVVLVTTDLDNYAQKQFYCHLLIFVMYSVISLCVVMYPWNPWTVDHNVYRICENIICLDDRINYCQK